MLIVTAAIIKKNNKILIAQRKEEAHNGLKWEFPGGKIEPNETPENCLIREIYEEINIKIKIVDIFQVVYHKYTDREVLLLAYKCEYVSGNVILKDCNAIEWIDVKDLKKYDIADADLEIVEKLCDF